MVSLISWHRNVTILGRRNLLARKSEDLNAARTSGAISMTSSSFFESLATLLSSHALDTMAFTQSGRLVQRIYTDVVKNVEMGWNLTRFTLLTP